MRLMFYLLAAGDCGNDADFVAVFERCFAIFQEANVFLVHVYVNEPADFAFFIDEPFLDSRKTVLEFSDGFANGRGLDLDQFFVVGQLAERSRDADFFCHKFSN